MPNPPLTVTIVRVFRVPVRVSYKVSFDPNTGEADIVSDGRIVQAPDTMRRREILEREKLDRVDDASYATLLDEGVIPMPKHGDTVCLSGEEYRLSNQFEPDPELEGYDVIARLVQAAAPHAHRDTTQTLSRIKW